MMYADFTGVILAGGQNTRFGGRNKALRTFGDKRIFDHIFTTFEALFEHIIIVSNDPQSYLEWDATIVSDLFQIRSSLTGLHSGLFYMQTPFAFFSACDTPFLKKQLVGLLLASTKAGDDIVLPDTAAGLEPLCAVYSKRCLQPIEAKLKQKQLAIRKIFKRLKVKKISETRLRKVDPELNSFFNVNTPGDLQRARALNGRKEN